MPPKNYAQDFSALIGNTPLVYLRRPSEITGAHIYGKCEFMNPGGSIKDRAALAIINAAEKQGDLKPGGLIVEGTAGNTGIGISLVARSRGYRALIVIPRTQTEEKKAMIRMAGAELLEVDAAPYKDPKNYIRVSERIAKEKAAASESVIWANQFDNIANRQGHEATTGPEIWQQTDGKIDGFICAVGTGGTIAGVASALRSFHKNVKIGLADPPGAALYEYYQNGVLKSEGSSITEGIGQGRITANLDGFQPDFSYQIPDDEGLTAAFSLLQDEGLCLGLSSGVNVAGAIRLAKELGKGKTIVTILCDGAVRYQSKMFNIEFLKSKNLPYPQWMA